MPGLNCLRAFNIYSHVRRYILVNLNSGPIVARDIVRTSEGANHP
jgi:hypothetical protein